MGLQDLLTVTIPQIKRRLNKRLEIEGILPTMTTNQRVCRDMLAVICDIYGKTVPICDCAIPLRAAVRQASARRMNCVSKEKCAAAKAYRALARQIIGEEDAVGDEDRSCEGTGLADAR